MSAKINNIKITLNKDRVFYVIFLLLILLPQYFRGGYFESTYLPFIVGISILMIAHIWNRYKGTKESLVKNETDLLLVGLILIYSITFFYGINKRGSLIEFVKNASYLWVFFISRDLHKDNSMRSKTIDFILLSGVIASIIGIGTMIGTWEYDASYSGARLSSTFQYPNTLAVYVVAMYFLTMGQALVNADPKKIGLYGGGLFIFFSTLIFTYSRGMWVLFPFLLLGFFIVLSVNKKVELFFYTLGSIIIAAPLSFLFMKHLDSGSSAKLWILYIGGTVISGLVLYFIGKATELLNKISWKTVMTIVLVIGLGTTVLLLMATRATEPLLYENKTDEIVVNQLSRTIRDASPNTEYEINIKGSASLEEESVFAGSVLVYSVDEQAKYTSIVTSYIEDNGEFDIIIPITTLEDTKSLVVRFRNEKPNTSIIFNESFIEDIMTEEINKIPLKYKYIPEDIVSRVLGISASDNSFQARVIFSIDALKLVSRRLLFGLGGEGWATAYKSIQSYPYWSRYVHNHYLEVLVEVGLIGFTLFVGFLCGLIYKYIKNKKNDEDEINKTLTDTLFITIGTILTHAAMDFDLSIVGLTILLWALIGMLDSVISVPKDEIKLYKLSINGIILKKSNILITILAFSTLVLSTTMHGAGVYANKAANAKELGDIDTLEKYMLKMTLLDPYNTTYISDLMNIYFFQYEAKSDETYGYYAMLQADKLKKLGENNPSVYIEIADAYLNFGMTDEALEAIYKSVKMQPLVIESYMQGVDSYITVFNYYIRKGDFEKASHVAFEGSSKLDTLLRESSERSIRPLGKNNQLYYKLSELKYYANYFDEFRSYYDNSYDLIYAYDFSLDVDSDGNIELINIWNAEGGELSCKSVSDSEEYIKLVNPGENYGVFDLVELNLEAETNYLVTFDARGDMASEKASYYMMDPTSQEQLQSPSTPMELSDDWITYEIEFITQADIKEYTSRFRFVISGENKGQIDLRNIKIFEKLN